jgi:hypothetical protein
VNYLSCREDLPRYSGLGTLVDELSMIMCAVLSSPENWMTLVPYLMIFIKLVILTLRII